MLTALSLGVATLAVAWLFSQVSPAWTTRYLGVALGPIFLLASVGLARAGNLGLVALVIVLGHLGGPQDQQPREQVQRRGPRERRGGGHAARATSW